MLFGLKATALTMKLWLRRGSAPGLAKSHNRTVLSSLPEARVCPSGLNATDQIISSWPRRRRSLGLPLAKSHSRTVRSAMLLEARDLPSELKATVLTTNSWYRIWGLPGLAGSHSRTVPSRLLEASRNFCLSGLNATAATGPSWPGRIRGSALGLSKFQSRTVLSSLPEAGVRPSGLKATDQTYTFMATQNAGFSARIVQVPQSYCFVPTAGG